MPHVGAAEAGEDLASCDEIKVYKDEGDEEDDKPNIENLSEEKLCLLTETEECKISDVRSCFSPNGSPIGLNLVGKATDFLFRDQLPFPLIPPYPYPSTSPLSAVGKFFPPHPGLGFFMYGPESSSHPPPPPAHMGIPPLHLDLKTGLPRPPMYGLPPSPGHPFYHPPDFLSVSSASLHSPYTPPTLTGSPLSWFPPPPSLFQPHLGLSHHQPPHSRLHDLSPLSEENSRLIGGSKISAAERKRNYVKKPLNAFMIFMKEMRQKVIEECTLKESAAINQILGRKWHALDRSEQAKYYDMARKEKELHMQMHPGWSARDNYATHTKKKKVPTATLR